MTETEEDDLLEEINSALNESDEEKAQNLLSCGKKLKNDNVVEEKVFQMLDSTLKFIECNFQCKSMIQKCYQINHIS